MRENLKSARRAAGYTQQRMADRLGIGLRQYQRIESGVSGGVFEIWDALEELLGVHQRTLREIEEKRPAQVENRRGRPKNQQAVLNAQYQG